MAFDPDALELYEGRRLPRCQPEPLTHLLHAAGLRAVRGRAIDVTTDCRDCDEYWSPLLGAKDRTPVTPWP